LKLLKKLDKDISRLDRTIDKIQTEKKAKNIFKFGKHANSKIIHNITSQPIHLKYVGTQYIIVNGCVVILQNNY
jgi:hypothetical protein